LSIAQNIYFHLNHPIRYVYLCGVITEIEYIKNIYTILTLDDGSGATIEVRITHVTPTAVRPQVAAQAEQGEAEDNGDDFWLETARDRKAQSSASTTTVYKTHTADLTVRMAAFFDNSIFLGGQCIDIGTTIKAKGTLNLRWDNFQLNLLRAFIVQDVDAEVEVWEGYAEFCEQVLVKPWLLSSQEVKRLEKADKERLAKERRKSSKEKERLMLGKAKDAERIEKEKEKQRLWAEKLKRHEVRAEKRRRIEEIELNGKPLAGV
jgi:hypothetical protein